MDNKKDFKRIFGPLFIILLLFSWESLKAQEPIGLIDDNYLPSSSILINPASPLTSPVPIDINVVSADVLAYNNLAYSDHFSLLSLAGNQSNNMPVAYNTPKTIREFSRASFQGPSAIIRENSFSYGIITQFRSATSLITQDVPSNLNFNNLLDDSLYQFPASKLVGMNWMEIGIHLGKTLNRHGAPQIFTGVNVKYLAGWDGISAVTNQPNTFIKNSESGTMSFNHVNLNYGYTSGFGNDVATGLTSFQFKGSGAGVDAGIFITNTHDPVHYKWKAGVSLVDLGAISFSKNIQRYEIITDTAVTATKQDFNSLNSADAFTELAAQLIPGKGTMNALNGPLVIWLPAAFTFQGEVALQSHFYLHGLVVQRVKISDQQVQRPNSLTVTPRYEIKNFSAGFPLDWYDYHHLQLGAYVRLGPFVVGSDNLGALFVPSKFEGADIYAGLHIFLDKKDTIKRPKTGKVYCPRF